MYSSCHFISKFMSKYIVSKHIFTISVIVYLILNTNDGKKCYQLVYTLNKLRSSKNLLTEFIILILNGFDLIIRVC